jgi:hypothetical protein
VNVARDASRVKSFKASPETLSVADAAQIGSSSLRENRPGRCLFRLVASGLNIKLFEIPDAPELVLICSSELTSISDVSFAYVEPQHPLNEAES